MVNTRVDYDFDDFYEKKQIHDEKIQKIYTWVFLLQKHDKL